MNAPTALEEELRSRLALVRSVVQRSAEPLHRPLGFDFRPTPGMTHLQAWQEHDARVRLGQSFAPATVYVNIPFCARVCTYCLLSSARVPARDVVERYVDALVQEIELFEPNVRSLRFGSLHVGGGTPTLLNEAQLDRLFTALTRLPFAEHARFGVEAHPSTSSRERLEVLARHGVHRLSFGVESWTPEVLRNVNRQDQTAARVRDAVRTARELGFSINIDLLAGLPGETLESWERSVRQTLELEPDSCSVNRFFAENSSLASHGYGPNEADRSLANAMLLEADALIRSLAPPRWPREPLRQGGFGTQYVWDRSSAARRYFQSDMVGPVSTLTFGVGALGHLYGRYHSIPAGGVPEYLASLEAAEPPEMLTSPLDERAEMAFFVAEQACQGNLTVELFREVFGKELVGVFGAELAYLLRESLLLRKEHRICKSPDPSFHVTHLLAFLARSSASLAEDLRALSPAVPIPEASAEPLSEAEILGPPSEASVLEPPSEAGLLEPPSEAGLLEPPRRYLPLAAGDDFEAALQGLAANTEVHVDVGAGLDVAAATRLAAAGRAKRLKLQVRADRARLVREYEEIGLELPASMLWVRLAIRASQASRGEQPDASDR